VVVTRDAQGRIVIGDRPGAEAMSRPYPNPFPETP
jgi:hypothetical protein